MAVNISNVLQINGHYVVLCPTHDKGPLEKFVNPDIKLCCLYKRNTFDLSAFFRLLRILKKNNIDIIHAHSSSIFWAIAAKVFNPGIKIIWHDHFGFSDQLKDTDRKINKLISPLMYAIIAVNKELRQWSIRNMKVRPDRILLINNFPLLGQISKKSSNGRITILCLANLRPQKDHPTLVKAIHLLHTNHPLLNFNVIFAGLFWKDDYYTIITDMIIEFDLKERIQIIGPVEETTSLLASADIGVLSSISEGLPVSLLEYGLAGLPVVITDVGQCAEVVGYGRFGRVVPPEDPETLADELCWIIHNSISAVQMGDAFREHVTNEYGPGQFMKQYQSLLDNFI